MCDLQAHSQARTFALPFADDDLGLGLPSAQTEDLDMESVSASLGLLPDDADDKKLPAGAPGKK